MAPIADIVFFHSNSTYFAKAVLLTLESQYMFYEKYGILHLWECLLRNGYLCTDKIPVADM